jgi:DNA transposition AAA+ family ATPase
LPGAVTRCYSILGLGKTQKGVNVCNIEERTKKRKPNVV